MTERSSVSTDPAPRPVELKCHLCLKNAVVVDKPIYYLPCLHILCHHCRDVQKVSNARHIKCNSCNRLFLEDSVYDDFNSDPRRTKCMSENCSENNEDKITHFCASCRKYLCSRCATNHDRDHFVRERICHDCLARHQQACPRASHCTPFNDVSRKALQCLSPLVENDRRSLEYYQQLIRNVHGRRRMIMAEFHNTRTGLAHDCRRMVSLLIQRFQDIANAVDGSENVLLANYKRLERAIGLEMNQIAKVNQLESKVFNLKPSRIIPFASFIKAASIHCMENSRYNRVNVDQICPPHCVRVDFSHSPQSSNFIQFLGGFGTVIVDNVRQPVKSTFDKPLTFELAPKLNSAEVANSAFGLKKFNGKNYEDIDMDKVRRSIKPLAEEDLRERVLQLESELNYYKRLAASLESKYHVTPDKAHFPPPTARLVSHQEPQSPQFPPAFFPHNGHNLNGSIHNMMNMPCTSRSMPINGRLHMRPPMNMTIPQMVPPISSPVYPNPPMMPQRPFMQMHLPPIPPRECQIPLNSVPSWDQDKDVVTITLDDERATKSNGKQLCSSNEDEDSSQPGPSDRDPRPPSTHSNARGVHFDGYSSEQARDCEPAEQRSQSLAPHPPPDTDHHNNETVVSASAPSSHKTHREKSVESHNSDRSAGRYRAMLEEGGLKIRLRREDPGKTDKEDEVKQEDEGETSRKADACAQQDEWDDYCYSCNEGCDEVSGELGCCSTCPRVFHQLCHIPQCPVPMQELPDDWKCSLCLPAEPLTEKTGDFNDNVRHICAKVLLSCLDDSQQSDPFRKPVEKHFVEYYQIITNPMDFSTINNRLSKREYKTADQFVTDMNTVFINCSTFNAPENELAKCGVKVYTKFRDAVKRLMPAYIGSVWMYITLHRRNADEPTKKRRRT